MRYAVEDEVLVITLLSEVPDGPAFVAKLREIMADDAVPHGLPILVDVRQAEAAPSAEEVKAVSAFFADTNFFSSVSALLVGTSLQYGVGRMGAAYEALQDRTLRVFWDEAEARAFLKSRAAAE